jgi:hypothetical protein
LPAATLYLIAAVRYAVIGARDPPILVLAVAIAFVLLGEAMLQTAFSRNWHASWWEWHILMLTAFAWSRSRPDASGARSASALSTRRRRPGAGAK